jgi:hypothetical protein
MKAPASRPSPRSRQGTLVSLDGVSGSALKTVAQALKTNGYRGAGISEWDASGIFGELAAAEHDAGAPSPRVLLLLYAADLAFRLRWEIRPALAKGRIVIAAPYIQTAVAFGRAAGVPGGWVRNLFSFAPHAADTRSVDASSARGYLQGFVEFACQHVAGTRTGLSKEQLMARTRSYLKTGAGRTRR